MHARRSQRRIVNTILGHRLGLYLFPKLRKVPLEQVNKINVNSKSMNLLSTAPYVKVSLSRFQVDKLEEHCFEFEVKELWRDSKG